MFWTRWSNLKSNETRCRGGGISSHLALTNHRKPNLFPPCWIVCQACIISTIQSATCQLQLINQISPVNLAAIVIKILQLFPPISLQCMCIVLRRQIYYVQWIVEKCTDIWARLLGYHKMYNRMQVIDIKLITGTNVSYTN